MWFEKLEKDTVDANSAQISYCVSRTMESKRILELKILSVPKQTKN